jgi:hypothetical protein
LHNAKIRIPDLGALSALYTWSHFTPTELVMQHLSRLNESFFENFLPLMTSQVAQTLYDFSDEFLIQDVFSQVEPPLLNQTIDQLLYDPLYGWTK